MARPSWTILFSMLFVAGSVNLYSLSANLSRKTSVRKIISKYENHIPVEVVFQDLNDLPEGFTCPEGREKPWGTNHAVLMGKEGYQ